MDEMLCIMDINYSFFEKRKHMFQYEVMNLNTRVNFKVLLYLITIVNFHLWKCRNEFVHQQENFDLEKYIKKLIRSIGARKRLQIHSSINEDRKIPRIDEMFNAIVTLQNVVFPLDNG